MGGVDLHELFLRQEVRATPWIDFDEFDSVGRVLVSTADLLGAKNGSAGEAGLSFGWDGIKWALERVEVWKLRTCASWSSLPQAVEATHALAQCLWTDRAASNARIRPADSEEEEDSGGARPAPPPLPPTALSHLYGMAITRTVNGLTDTLQQSRAYASSVLHLSQLLGIPGWIVDVRHRSTHNQMPSIVVLRSAAATLIRYLDQVYWSPIRNNRNVAVSQALRLIAMAEPSQPDAAAPSAQTRKQHGICITQVEHKGTDDDSDTLGLSNHSVLGTCYNHFGVLSEGKKRTKKARKAKANESGRSEGAEPRASGAEPTAIRSLPTWNDIPLDVSYQVLSDHVSQFCRSSAAAPPPSPGSAAHDVPFELVAYANMSRTFPGLARAVVRRLREKAESDRLPCSSGDGSPSSSSSSSLFTRSWIAYLLGLAQDGIEEPRNLGHVSRFQATKAFSIGASDARSAEAGASTGSAELGAGAMRVALTLEEMEDLLHKKDQGTEHNSAGGSTRDDDATAAIGSPGHHQPPAIVAESGARWALCENWEPCSIGSCVADSHRPSL
jgi:hypothetical protein